MSDIREYLSLRRLAYWTWAAIRLATVDLTDGWLNLFQLARSTAVGGSPFTIHVRGTRHRFKVITAADVWAVYEIFVRQEYGWDQLGKMPAAVIIDIGAHIGVFSVWARSHFPHSTVYAYEPYPGSYELLRDNLAGNGFTDVLTFRQAVWGRPATLVMDTERPFPGMYSTHEVTSPGHPGLRVSATSLDAMFAEHCLERCDILKMDCEGAEGEILFKTSDATLNRIHYILMEYHDDLAVRTHVELAAHLARHGFEVVTKLNPALKGTGYLFAMNAGALGHAAPGPVS